jgi:oligoendopeptidase F
MGKIDPTKPELGEMPVWDLSDLYPGRESEAYKRDLAGSREGAKAFRARYEGKLASLSGVELGGAVAAYERIDETLGRIMTFAYLSYAQAVEDSATAQFFQAAREAVTEISRDLLFFTLDLRKLDDAQLAEKLKAPELAKYEPWLRDLRVMKPHQLSDELEQYMLDKSVVGAAAWNRLFDETMAGLRFTINGQELRSAQAFHLLSEPERAVREAAATEISRVLGANIKLFALITNTLAKDKEIGDRWRKFTQPQSARNLSNLVEDEVVDALHRSVKAAYPKLAHRYYTMKAKWLGLEKLEFWDRNAPLPETDNRIIPWCEAQRMVLGAYQAFSPQLASTIEPFFSKNWIDAPVYAGKESGAFSHPAVPAVHPYVLMNYQGRPRDVMTLAHELGHGAHQVLAGSQGHLIAETPLTLAETASVFGEMLTFRSLLAAETDTKKRKALLAGKVEDMLNTVVRQIAFYDFELRVHTERRSGELSPDRLGEIWLEVAKESLGPAFNFREDYRHYWAYIPHFIHSPFYVYAYAFGDCLVNSLYATYQQQPEGFQQKYLAMLSAGGRHRHKELLAPFGLDATDPGFWQRGLGVVSGLIDELEALA